MNKKVFQSKFFVISVIFLFILLTSSDVLPQRNVSAESDVEKLVQEGKELYKNGEYKEAILKFLAAKDLAQTRKEISEIHFNISLAYYANNQSIEASEHLQKLLEIQPERTINTLDYHPRFVELFNQLKSEAAKLKEKRPVVKAKPGEEKKVKKGGGGFLLVIGALVVGGGVAAALLLGKKENGGTNGGLTTGSIQVNSSPTGAQVFLDGSDTGSTTNTTLTNVSPGSHTVSLVMEGYEDEQTSVSVTAGQTATVSVTLTKPTITVPEITTSTVWTTGEEVEIKWETSGSGTSQGVASTSAGLNSLIHHGRNVLFPFQRRAFQERRFQRNLIKERRRAENVDSSGNRGILSSNTSEPQGISAEISSSVKEGDIVHKRAKDIRDIKRNSGVGRVNIPVVPRIYAEKFMPSGDIRALGLSNVKIELYKGDTFNQNIAESTENDGSYTWTVDSSLEDGTDYKVRILSTSDSTVYGESDAFTIEEKSITVTEPTNITVWARGFPVDITWTSNGTINDVKIDLFKGDILNQTIVSSTANDGSYTWTEVDTSLADGTDYKVRISSTGDSSVYGESDEFTIREKSITVTEPTGSTVWSQGYSADITWTSKGTINNVIIDLYKGTTFEETIISSTENDGTYTWTEVNSTLADGTNYKVKISCESDSSVFDESNEFTIEGKSTTVTEPTGSTVWSQGYSADITWTSTGAISNAKIDLYKGSTFEETIVSSTENDGTYTWTDVSSTLADGTDYKVRVSSTTDSGLYGESDAFKIEGKSVTVTEPTNSSSWTKGKTVDINWTSKGAISGNVKIDLYKGSSLERTIASDTANDGAYQWTVDPTLNDDTDYKVRVSSITEPGIYGESETFTIEDKSITVTAPTSSTIWARGYPTDITWTSTGTINNVKIDLYKGTTFNQTIVESTENDGTYTWTEVDSSLQNGLDYIVRISSASDSGVYGESDAFEISHSYEFVIKWGGQGGEDGKFSSPTRLAVDNSGYVYVADTNNERIQKFTSDGTFVTKWGGAGSGDGEFSSPSGVAVDSSGYVYVSDTGNSRIQKFTSSGTYVSQWGSYGSGNGQFNNPGGIAVDDFDYVYVVDTGFFNSRIQKFTISGTYVTQWGSYGSASGQFEGLQDLAVDDSGYVYTVEDSPGNRVQKFTSDGTFVTKWGSFGQGTDQFVWPVGIAADKDGFVYVSDFLDRIKKHEYGGAYVTLFGSSGSGDGQFNEPIGIAVDSSGNVYVADTGNNRIQKFRLSSSSSSSLQLNLNNPRAINNNFSTIKSSKTKSNKIKSSLTNRLKEQQKQIKKKDEENEKRK